MKLWIVLSVAAYLAISSDGHKAPNPIEAMRNVMHRMRIEIGMIPAPKARMQRLAQFKSHVQRVIRVHLVIMHGAPPPPRVMAKLQVFMKAKEHELEQHMHALMATVSQTLGHQKVHLFVKKVREHCNRHITQERKKILEKLDVKPKKKFIAMDGRWDMNQAKDVCHQHGGHLAAIVSIEDRLAAMNVIKKGEKYFVNPVGTNSRHALWMMPIRSPWIIPHNSLHCAELGRVNNGQVTAVNCSEKRGALCEFLTFNPWVRFVGQKAYFGFDGRWNFKQAKARCAKYGGRIATVSNNKEMKMLWLNRTEGPAYIGAWRKIAKNGKDYKWYMGSSPMQWSKARQHKDAGIGFDCYAMVSGGYWKQVSCNKRLSVMCEARVVPDDRVRSIDPEAKGKIFVAYNKKVDLFNRQQAEWKCTAIGGRLAKIRSNMHQSAALVAIGRGNRVLLDPVHKDKDGHLRWSDRTRFSRTQSWRLIGDKNISKSTTQTCISLNRYGTWEVQNCLKKSGVLCEIVYRGKPTNQYLDIYDFETDIRMDVDFEKVTKSGASEKAFRRAMENEVVRSIKIIEPKVTDAVVVLLKKGSTIATVRVWTKGDGRPEAKALRIAIIKGDFAIHFMGRTIRPTKDQLIDIEFTMTICWISPVLRHNLFIIVILIVTSITFLAAASIVIVLLRRGKKQKRQIDSVFTVKGEKELLDEEERNKASEAYDPPPPYPVQPEEPPPDYSACVALADKEMKV